MTKYRRNDIILLLKEMEPSIPIPIKLEVYNETDRQVALIQTRHTLKAIRLLNQQPKAVGIVLTVGGQSL